MAVKPAFIEEWGTLDKALLSILRKFMSRIEIKDMLEKHERMKPIRVYDRGGVGTDDAITAYMNAKFEVMEMVENHEKMKPNYVEITMPATSGAEAHVGRNRRTTWGLPRTPEEIEAASDRFNLVTGWITDGRIKVIRQEDGEGFRMFYRTVNGYEFGPEYADDGGVFARVALAVQSSGGS